MTTPREPTTAPTIAADDEWSHPRPETLPRPTYWPAALAFGITATAFGIVTTTVISGVGLLVCAVAVGGWIFELRRER